MKKKYKLIETYPGSLSLGSVVEQLGDNALYFYGNHILSKSIVENNPKFWENVVEKDYEILSFMFYGVALHERFENKFNGYSEEIILASNEHKIYSVKRLSDGEVFTVGDKIITVSTEEITGFDIRKKGSILKEGVWINFNSGFSHLNSSRKAEPALFKTEDGVEIFEGDKYSFIWISSPAKGQSINTPYTKVAKKLSEEESWSKSAKFFSTEEAAEKYVKMNKPEFSRNQVIEMIEKVSNTPREIIINYFFNNKNNGNN